MKRKEYRGTSFNLPCNRHLWKVLGEYDALMQYAECAIISFEEQSLASGLSFQEFLKSQAEKMSHPISNLSFMYPRQILHNLYLILPYSCLDTYIDGLVQNMRELGFNNFSIADTKGVSKLENLRTALLRVGIIPKFDEFNIPIFKYYRLLRNKFSHNITSTKDVEILNAYKNVINFKDEIDYRFKNVNSLKYVGKLEFADYILCTANIKNICDKIVISIESHINWDNYIIKKEINKGIKRIKGLNEKRQLCYVNNFILTRFSIFLPESSYRKILKNSIEYIESI